MISKVKLVNPNGVLFRGHFPLKDCPSEKGPGAFLTRDTSDSPTASPDANPRVLAHDPTNPFLFLDSKFLDHLH